MKKILLLILCSFILMNFGTVASAESVWEVLGEKEDILTESDDFEGVKKLEAEMLRGLEDMCDWLKDPSDFPESMDFSMAVKVYVDTGIQNYETDQEKEIIKNFGQSEYVWVIPMVISGENVTVTVAKGQPLNEERASVLTSEEKDEIRDQEGKWTISEWAVGVGDPLLSQVQDKKDLLKDCNRAVLVGGVPGLHEPAVLGFKEGKAALWMPLGFSYPMLEDLPKSRGVSNGLYQYSDVIEASQEYVRYINSGSGGGGSIVEKEPPVSIFIVIVSVAVVSVFAAIFVIWERKKAE